jgi:hypothetical protein
MGAEQSPVRTLQRFGTNSFCQHIVERYKELEQNQNSSAILKKVRDESSPASTFEGR